jgi:hypothetical protein
MRRVTVWLDIGVAISAGLAAIFWFRSAVRALSPMVAYLDQTPQIDPFYQALIFSAQMNRWAAAFSFVSGVCLIASMALRAIATRP